MWGVVISMGLSVANSLVREMECNHRYEVIYCDIAGQGPLETLKEEEMPNRTKISIC